MTQARRLQPGITTLLRHHSTWLRGQRVAVVSHPAAVDQSGRQTVAAILESGLARHVTLWGPEHGFFGDAGAGEPVPGATHPLWGVRIHSLYGATRRPTARMLREVDLILFDLQDLGVRCYTYVSTLRYVLEAAATHGTPVIVADRPIPFPITVDGPLLQPACDSFVGAIPAPLVYGMTPAETARWLKQHLQLDLDLRVAPLTGYHREPWRAIHGPPWVPPSPGIATWESAWCYPATVFTEALQGLDCGRPTRLPFQSLTAPWIRATEFCAGLRAHELPGIAFQPCVVRRGATIGRGRLAQGVRLVVTDPHRYRPVLTAITLIHALQTHAGMSRVWARRHTRPDFFDKLFGDPAVRVALRAGVPPADIAATWRTAATAFRRERAAALLYSEAT